MSSTQQLILGEVPSAGVVPAQQISRSLRFDSASSPNLNRTWSTPTNAKIGTLSFWCKRSKLGDGSQVILQNSTNAIYCGFDNNNTGDDKFGVYLNNNTTKQVRVTTQVFRDPSAWYHFVLAIDTANATAANRLKFYVNNVQVSDFSTSNTIDQNIDVFTADTYRIGSYSGTVEFLDGYLTEVNFIDGQALTPSSFGQANSGTGVWEPIAYTGTYGANGFYLNFSDNSNTTSTTLGKDYSGNGNNWTPTAGFSVAAGAGNDSLVDTPTPYGTDTGAGGEVRGNYSTFNPNDFSGSASGLLNGNLDISGLSMGNFGTFKLTSGKWYFEFRKNADGDNQLGIATGGVFNNGNNFGVTCFRRAWRDNNNSPSWLTDGSNAGSGTAQALSTGDILGVALDLDNNAVYFAKNNTWMNSGVPTSGSSKTGAIWTDLSGGLWQIYAGGNANGCYTSLNTGQRPFQYTAPSGFKTLCTQNLPTPTIGATSATRANKYFDVVLRNGGGSSGGTYSTTVNMSNGAWLWDKPRNQASSNYLIDSVRGISKYLVSNATQAENTDATFFTNFGSSSFTTGSTDWGTTVTVVDWIWAANGSGSTNNAGSIQSTVSANTTAGFSIVTYTGTGANATVGHGLGVAPSMVIVKDRDAVRSWNVWHSLLSGTQFLLLETTDGTQTDATKWNSTTPTSSVFSVGTAAGTNTNTEKYVAYCFAPVAGYSAFGSFTGNGSTDGAFVYTGFRPAWVMMKVTSDIGAGGNWGMFDNDRLGYNPAQRDLRANLSNAEGTDDNIIDFLSNGFKIRTTSGGFGGGSGNTYIYAAFAEFPFKYTLAR